jgi:hypothetical protein
VLILAERLTIIVIAGMAIAMGWNLFVRSIMPDQQGKIEVGNWKVELKKVGPGIFFAAFGAIILTTAFVQPMAAKWDTEKGEIKGATPTSDNEWRPYMAAINSLRMISGSIAAGAPREDTTLVVLSAQAGDLQAASRHLSRLQRELLVEKFGAKAMQEWDRNGEEFIKNPTSVSAEQRAVLEKIRPWMTDTVPSLSRR